MNKIFRLFPYFKGREEKVDKPHEGKGRDGREGKRREEKKREERKGE